MSVKISQALTAEGVIAYHAEEYAANYSSYYSESGHATGVWFGEEAAAFGLMPGTPVQLEHFERLANGQDPHSGLQLIEWRGAAQDKTPAWMRSDAAWKAHVEKLIVDSPEGVTGIFRQRAASESVKHSAQFAKLSKLASLPSSSDGNLTATGLHATDHATELDKYHDEYHESRAQLLEMHRIARETFAANLAADAAAQHYIKQRGIRLDTAKEFGLGLADNSGTQIIGKLRELKYSDELIEASGLAVRRGNQLIDRFRGRLMFPIENATGETIAFAGRKPPGRENGPKYINSPETELYRKGEQLYNLHRASERIAETGQVVIVEGYLDAIAAYQAGQRNVVAASGTALSEVQASAIARCARTAIVNLDGDDAGKIAAEKHLSALLDRGVDVRVAAVPGDPAEWILNNGVKAYRKEIREVPPIISYLADRAREKFDTNDTYDRVDAVKWIVSTLEHVQPEQRVRIAEELEAHLGTPKISAGEAKQESKIADHRAAWDITFGAPKTVSLTALVGGDERIVKAHDEAVREGMGYFERAIQVKMGGLNAPQTTGRMVAALFRHDTARPVNGYAAPHLHTHGVVFNLSMDHDGQHRALNPKELFYLQGAAEAVYQNAMAVRLKALGYELEYGKNLAIEIKGYTEEYRRAESPRRSDIEAEQRRLGQFGPNASNYIALNTREAKLNLTSEQVRSMHLEKAQIFGNQPQQVVKNVQGKHRQPYDQSYRRQVAGEAVQFAKHRLSERTTVMEWWEIDRDALRFGRGYITLEDVEGAFQRSKERGEFKRTEHWRNYAPESRYTTPELQASEHEILSFMAAGRGRVGAIAGTITKDEFREPFRDHLNNGQKHLVWNLIHAEDRMVGVQGLAGTGKTRALATVQDFAQRYGYEVRGIAATSGAVGELRKVGIVSDTLAAHPLKAEKQIRPRLYLLDEASLTDVHQMSSFLESLKPVDRLIVIGDTKQHASLGAGRIFAELQDAGMQTFQLKQIVRQRPESYREVVKDLSQGQIKAALEKLENEARVHEFGDERIRQRAIALWYGRDPEHTLVVSPDNRSRQQISDAIRTRRQDAGELTGEVYRMRALESRSLTKEDLRFAGSYNVGDVIVYSRSSKKGPNKGDQASVVNVDRERNLLTVMLERDGKIFEYNPRRAGTSANVYEPTIRELQAGDRLQFTRSLKTEGIANRTLGTLEMIDAAGNAAIRLEDRRRWTGNLERMPHLDHGYVMTSYSAQGTAAERVLIHLDTDAPGVSRMLTQQLIYVAASRGREEMHVFTNAREELAQTLLRSEEKAAALAPEAIAQYRGLSR